MEISANPQWQQLAIYASGGAILLAILFNIPFVGRVLRTLFLLALLGLSLFLLIQQAPFDPTLGRITGRIGLDSQTVSGDEVRIRMARDGHFWAQVSLNGYERRMLIDSGATITALSEQTATAASVKRGTSLLPVVMQTANGAVPAQTGTIARLMVGDIEARELKVVVSPALRGIDVLGMNFLSQLAFWRVEGRTLILMPQAANKPK